MAERGEGLGDLAVDLGRLLGLGQVPPGGLLALVVGSALGLSALLQSAHVPVSQNVPCK